MTGIERLREFAEGINPNIDVCGVTKMSYDREHKEEVRARLRDFLANIADQIERELSDERDRWESDLYEAQVAWNRVTGVCLEMERHRLYNADTVARDVARWARELRHAMKSDASDECGAQKPSWHDHADAADVTSGAAKVTRDPAEDVSVSAYDLLPEEEREAIAWVREHDGLDSVKNLLDWVVGHCSTRQQLDFDFWLSGRVMHELGFDEDMADRDEVERRLLARLMPEGYEWPKVDGKPVDFKTAYVPSLGVLEAVCIYSNGACEVMGHDGIIKGVKEIHVATPKVLAADGRPLREGETVWDTNGDELVIGAFEDGGQTVTCRYADVGDAIPVHGMWSPSDLTHERPESKCRDCAHWKKDPTANNMGVCWFFYHEHEGQDCYAARRGDIGACEEFMPRAKALAERGE